MSSQWDHRADKDLLLAIIDDGQLKSIKWSCIVLKMQEKGYSFSHEACRQHFQKIRRESKNGSSSPARTGSDSGLATPKAKKAPITPSSKRKSVSKATSNLAGSNDNDDEETFDATPSKKRKTAEKEEVSIKEENDYGAPVPVFKAEKDNHVDLSYDSLYDDSGVEEA